jgi:hypothetical protein
MTGSFPRARLIFEHTGTRPKSANFSVCGLLPTFNHFVGRFDEILRGQLGKVKGGFNALMALPFYNSN